MEHARPPAELSLEGGPACRADQWRKWLRQFQVFLKASGVHKEPSDVQASLLINLVGPEGYDIYSTFKFTEEKDREDLKKLIEKFNAHFGTKPNIIMVRFKFFTRNQEAGESIDEYVTALKLLSQQCEFEQLEDSLVRDRIVCGVCDVTVRDRLLRSDDLTLDKAVKICQTNEISNAEGKQIEGLKHESTKHASVDALWRGQPGRRGNGRSGGWRDRREGAAAVGVATERSVLRAGAGSSSAAGGSAHPSARRACAACASVRCDSGEFCPARKVKCFLCGNKGHFRVMCPRRSFKKVYELKESVVTESEEDLYYVSTLECVDSVTEDIKWYESLYLFDSGLEHRFKLDTGSDLNVISKASFLRLGLSLANVFPDNTRAKSFCGTYLVIIGSSIITWLHKNNKYELKFVITEQECESILGKHALDKLKLIKRIYNINLQKYEELFEGLGRLPGTYSIPIEYNANPCICPVRKIPLGEREKLQKELERMEELGVIRKVTHPTSWVNGIVVAAKKDGIIRVCLDPRPLNRVIRRQHYPLATLTEIASKLKDARYFSKLDAKSGFWMIQLDSKSADLCTFGTPFGRYQFLRLPYGINSASEVFHAKIRQILEDLDGVDSFVDDVWGSTKDEHDMRLEKLMTRARAVGIKFNRQKCEFCVTQVTYLGQTFSSEGMKIDENKLKAITNMPGPTDRQSLERFLGMVNYLSKFIPNYSEKVLPLRNLLKKDVEWYWGACEDRVVSELKQALCEAPVLALFGADAPCVVSVDASARALGAVLLQEGRPVEFASLTLTETQQRYAQIEKEMLAIVFALERFHQYIFGKSDVTVETDHKPLEALFQKSLDSAPARLQRMMLRVQRYDFKITYKPGKYMYVADTLSRAPLSDLLHNKISEELDEQSCFIIQNVRFSNTKLDLIKSYTRSDEECQVLLKYIMEGWPVNKYDVDERARHHWSYKESFEYIDGVIFVNNLVYIPKGLRGEMLQRVHEGHLGIDKCKRRARDVMFWAGMSRDVGQTVRRCRVCAQHAPRPQREPMMPHHIPPLPWSKIGSDIYEYNKKYYLMLVDYFSNYVEIAPLKSITTKQVILALKDQFARHGVPQELFTDNGPAYASKEFRNFAVAWGFKHTTSSPHYPQSNGRSERAIRTIKNLLTKCISSGEDFYLALLNYRSSPRDGISSPAQLLMGRRLNTRLPVRDAMLKPERDCSNDFQNIITNQERGASCYDARSRPLPELQPGDEVVAIGGPRRQLARVTGPAPHPRSYFLTDYTGRVLRRNRRHLIKLEPNEEPDLQSPATSSPATCEDDHEFSTDDSFEQEATSSRDSEDYDSCSTTPDKNSKKQTEDIQPKSKRAAASRARKNLKEVKF